MKEFFDINLIIICMTVFYVDVLHFAIDMFYFYSIIVLRHNKVKRIVNNISNQQLSSKVILYQIY